MRSSMRQEHRARADAARGEGASVERLENRRHLDGTLPAGVSVVMSGLDNPRGMDFGPQGALYIAEAGRGGGPDAPGFVLRGTTLSYGATGAVSRLWKGQQERVARGLPSLAQASGNEAAGPSDVSFNGVGNAYVTVGFGANPGLRAALGPAGAGFAQLIRLKPNGDSGSVADLGAYEQNANPDGRQVDSNPFSVLMSAGGQMVVTDSGANSVLRVDNHGAVSTIATLPILPPSQVFDGDPVPTGLTVGPDGAYYVGILSGAPFRAGVANVYRVVPGETPIVFRSGFKTVIDVEFDDDGNLYVLQHSGGPAGLAAPGSVIRIAPDGTRSTVLEGLNAPTSMAISRDGALYVTNFGTTAGRGQVLRVLTREAATSAVFAGAQGISDARDPRKDNDSAFLSGAADVAS